MRAALGCCQATAITSGYTLDCLSDLLNKSVTGLLVPPKYAVNRIGAAGEAAPTLPGAMGGVWSRYSCFPVRSDRGTTPSPSVEEANVVLSSHSLLTVGGVQLVEVIIVTLV